MDNYTNLPSKHLNYALNGKVMLCTGIVLFVALLIIVCFHNYTRIFLRNRRRRYIRRRAQHLLPIATNSTPNTVASKGLDPSVIKTIPTSTYSTKADHSLPLECAVCLAEFENEEETRVLPMCNHIFHVDCIDMWFYSHSNCPLCRAPVRAHIPVDPNKTLDQTVVQLDEVALSEPPREDIEMNSSSAAASSSSSSSSPSPSTLKLESCPMKTLELVGVGILVEVPTGEDRSTDVTDVDSGSGNRILSQKSIWSV